MKKIMVYLLLIGQILNYFLPVSVYAKSVNILNGISVINTDTPTGNLELDLEFSLPMKNMENSNIQITLWKENESTTLDLNGITTMTTRSYTMDNHIGTVSFRKSNEYGNVINGTDGEDVHYYAITFYDLVQGDYTVELKGEGYISRAIDFTIDKYSKRISLTNAQGGFTVGDVNKDNIVDEKDLDTISTYLLEPGDYKKEYDLNRDGKINITDLTMISHVIYGKKSEIKIADTTAILTKEDISLSEETTHLEGKIEDLITGNSTVQVSPKEGEISKENPAVLAMELKETTNMEEIRLDVTEENTPEEMEIEVEDENGTLHTISHAFQYRKDASYFTDKASDNQIVIDLGKQIAVKKVTIRITKTSSHTLADISKVEFLNNVYEEVPDSTPESPKNVRVSTSSEKATVTWDNLQNVTGYEITLNKIINGLSSLEAKYTTVDTTLDFAELKNYTEYSVSVQAINGTWRSAPSDEVAFIPTPDRIPPAVEGVTMDAASSGFNIKFKKMSDTQSYNLYYREKGIGEFIKISGLTSTSYSLRNLTEGKEYEVYITGVNELGEGPKSQTVVGIVKTNTFPDISPYRHLNHSLGDGVLTEHIKEIQYKNNSNNASNEAVADHDLSTYWSVNTWDVGGYNLGHGGPTITFDDTYTMNYLDIVPYDDTASIFYARVWYEDADGFLKETNADVSRLIAPNGQIYYRVTFDKVTTNKLEVNLANYSAGDLNISIREMYFYEYDSLEDDVNELFKDSLHVELQSWVTEEEIANLEKRTNTMDPVNKVYHPNKELILEELNYARQILNDTAAKDAISVDTNMFYNKDTHIGYAYNISDLQPLGISVKGGEEIIVYVGTSKEGYLPDLVVTQNYAEWSAWSTTIDLKEGRNVITIPHLTKSLDAEHGGAIYVRYPYSNASNVEVKVRVSGGIKIPTLDIRGITDETEKNEKIKKYIEELTEYVAEFRSTNTLNERLAVANITEIGTEDGLFSVAATACLDALTNASKDLEGQVTTLKTSLEAFDEMMALFYRQKGLVEDPEDKLNRLPTSRINIRYMRMFDGAFMYAGGGHIGIEYDSIAGLMQGKKAQVLSDGTVDTSGYFGWGISHEIGHQINHKSLAIAEVTNNIYALLAQTADDKDESRIASNYETIYKKVTSNTKGKSSNVFVTLAMYWQLHLAYDDNQTFYDTNSIYAKINRLARSTKLQGSKDDLLVMLASEAANRNLVSFFESWGLTPTQTAKDYASQFEPETRELRYLNDEARIYRMAGNKGISKNTKVVASLTEADSQNKRFTLTFDVTDEKDKILGYEIKRNGVVIGFTMENFFTDYVGTLNNRAIEYEVTAYDKLLNKTETIKLEEVKVSHDGSISKENFGIESNYTAENEIYNPENDMDFDSMEVNKLIDGQKETIFEGTKIIKLEGNQEFNGVGNPYIIIDLNSTMDISGVKYLSGGEHSIKKYKIYVSQTREPNSWILAKTGEFTEGENLIYFDKVGTTGGDQLWTYNDIGYVKIEAIEETGISGAEIDIIAPPGDNMELTSVSKLSEDYYYNTENENDYIPAGYVLFQGEYRGNPAFNVGLIADADKNLEYGDYTTGVYDGDFFAFATLASDKTVYEIANGTWMYAVSEEVYETMVGKDVRGVLLRVNDAKTNEGERVTSTSKKMTHLPAYNDLPSSTIKQNGGNE